MAKPAEIDSLYALQRFVQRWRLLHVLRLGLLALAAALAIMFLLSLWLSLPQALLIAAGIGIALWLVLLWRRPLSGITAQRAAALLDQRHPQLQHSTALVLQRPEQLSLPARLQQQHVSAVLGDVLSRQRPPLDFLMPLCAAALVFVAGSLIVRLWQPQVPALDPFFSATVLTAKDSARAQTAAVKRALPELEEGRIRMAPPAYTREAARFSELSDLLAPEASRITWQLRFNTAVQKVFMTNQQNETLRFSKTSKGAWVAQVEARKSIFYRIGYATATDTAFSPFLKISVQPDEAPRVRILKPEQYQLEQQGEAFGVELEALDDYGLEDVYLSLTISRGSGENVSFREEKIWIEEARGAKEIKKQLRLAPKALGMQPGDELYYRLEAHDNKPPRSQHRRSNSWFYQWQDTAAATSMLSSGMALGVEPEYFRSQRQIIMDTEKLISTQKSTPEAQWEKANQDLGVDQKLLRLRYGKFLGEEFESVAGGGVAHENEAADHNASGEDEHEDDNEYGNDRHQHDLPGHEEPAGAAPATGLLEMFGHAHDTEEGATFYEERIKVKLKAALAEMWEAEKYLRLSQPRKALPYEYRALKIIKDVQQSTRIYVERVGLELPNLIPQEHRLKGEQTKILPQNQHQRVSVTDTLVAVKQLLARLSYWESGSVFSSHEQQLLRQAGKEVARLLIQGGPYMQYFYLLNSLNSLAEAAVPAAQEVRQVQQGLLQLLPKQYAAVGSPQQLSEAQKLFLQSSGTTSRD